MDTKYYNESRVKALRKLLMEFNYEDLIKDEKYNILHWVPTKKHESFNEFIKQKRKYYKQRWNYIMFTINFKEGVPLSTIRKQVNKALKKKWIKKHLYAYESRGMVDNQEWVGIHIHIWCEVDENKYSYDCKREMYNTFKDCVGNKQHVNCRYTNDPNAFIDYVKGYKKGKPKKYYQEDRILNKYIEALPLL